MKCKNNSKHTNWFFTEPNWFFTEPIITLWYFLKPAIIVKGKDLILQFLADDVNMLIIPGK